MLAHERAEYSEASTFSEIQDMIADMEMNEHERAQSIIQGFWRRLSDRRADSSGPVDDASRAGIAGRHRVRSSG